MSLKVGELVAYIRADGSEFDRTLDQSGAKFGGFQRTVQAGVQATARSFAAVTTGTVGLVTALFKVGAGYNRLQQSSRAALSTLLGGAEAANAQMDKLDEFARSSPFAKQVFITAQQQLLGFGVTAERVIPTLDAIQNAVAAVGGSNEQVEQVTYALAQMQGQGKLTGETLNQLGQYGIDAATILGKELGKTGAEIRELASKPGGLPVDKVWDPLVKGLMDRFGGATANIKLQMDGAVDRVKGAWRDIGSIIAAPFIDPKGGGRAVEWVNKIADALRAAEQKAKPLVDLLVRRYQPALEAITPALDRMRSGINAIDLSQVNGGLDHLAKYAPLVAGTSAALFAMGTSNLPILSTLGITGINPVVAGLAALVAASPGLRQAGGDFLRALEPLLPVAGQLAVKLLDTAMLVGGELTPALADLLQAAAPLIVSLGIDLAGALTAVLDLLVPVASTAADVASAVSELPMPVLAAVAAFAALRALNAGAVLGSIAGAVRTFNDQARVQAALAGSSSGAVGALGAAAVGAQGGVRALGTALKVAFISNPIGLAIAGISTALGFFIAQQAESRARVDDLKNSFDKATGAITENTREIVANQLQSEGALKAARDLGIAEGDVTEAILGNLAARVRVKQVIDEVAAADRAAAESGGAYTNELAGQVDASAKLERALSDVGGEYARAKEISDEVTAATRANTDATGAQVDKLKELTDAQREATGATLSAREAAIRAVDAQKALTQAQTDGAQVTRDASGAVDANAESTRRVDEALIAWTRDQNAHTEAMARNNSKASELDATIRAQRDSFIANAQQMGYTRSEAEKLAASYGLIPNRVYTEIVAEAERAQLAIDRFISTNDGRRIRVTVDTNAGNTYNYAPGNKFVMSAQARGSLMEFFDQGGFHGLTPMSAVAQMVPPNTWRVVGDRARDPEAYIPLDGSVRSLAILDQAANRLGRRVLPMANGGVTAAPTPVTTAPLPDSLVAVMTDEQIERLAAAVVAAAGRTSAGAIRTARQWGPPR